MKDQGLHLTVDKTAKDLSMDLSMEANKPAAEAYPESAPAAPAAPAAAPRQTSFCIPPGRDVHTHMGRRIVSAGVAQATTESVSLDVSPPAAVMADSELSPVYTPPPHATPPPPPHHERDSDRQR
jgi:hypothetical protein